MNISASPEGVPWGPTGRAVYERTYSRPKPDGSKETWPETVARVAHGNLALVYGASREAWPQDVRDEYERLVRYMLRFAIIPAGRHLWATGVPGRQYLQNCFVSGWGEKLSEHFSFSFLRLMEGGGVGANYSVRHTAKYGVPRRPVWASVICDPAHPDYAELEPHLTRLGAVPPGTGWKYDQDEPYKSDDFTPGAGHEVADSREGWAAALTDLIDTAMSDDYDDSGMRVYDVSGVRPSGSRLKAFGGTASGPAPFARMMHEVARVLSSAWEAGILSPVGLMEIDHAISECVVSGGNRRSARMSIVRWDDPYVMDFIACKEDTGKHWTTNISVEVDDEFFRNLKEHAAGGTDHLPFQAKAVHDAVTRGMLKNGEPGYWNISLSEQGETGRLLATNPCGEVPLEAWEACNLGHVNLDAFAEDITGLEEAHRLITRFLIRATFADINDPGQREIQDKNRRIGVGHLGVQGFWAKVGVPYNRIPGRSAEFFLRDMYNVVRSEARGYAFSLRIPEPVKVTTVAPTGSIAKMPGVSEGIHPVYARWFERRVRFSLRDADQAEQVLKFEAEGFKVETDVYDQSGMTAVVVFPTEDILVGQVRELGLDESIVQAADEITPSDMLRVQRLYQEHWADNAVSYTVNIPAGTVTQDELAALLEEFLPHLKGTTIMVDESRPQAPYTRITKEEYEAAEARRAEDSVNEECASGACPVR